MFRERGNSLEGFHGGTRPRAAAQSIELSISRLAGSSDKVAHPLPSPSAPSPTFRHPSAPSLLARLVFFDQHARPSFARTILNRFGDRRGERSEKPPRFDHRSPSLGEIFFTLSRRSSFLSNTEVRREIYITSLTRF